MLVDIVILLVVYVLPSVWITGEISGIVIGVVVAVLLLLAVVFICFICYIRRKINTSNTLTLSNEVSLRGSMKVVPQNHALIITRLIIVLTVPIL